MNVRVVKIGGAALADESWLGTFAAHVVRGAERTAIVHGGGPDINALSEKLGLSFGWSSGRRVTSPELLDTARLVLSGRLNKRIVAALLSAGADAIGISGEDGNLIRARAADGGAIGRVGEVVAVRSELLDWMLSRELIPVISPISRGPDGDGLNVNADEVAGAVASSLNAPELLFITDVPGVMQDGVVLNEVSVGEVESLIRSATASGGMALKLKAAMKALSMGVASVRIGTFLTLHNPNAGTRIRIEAEVLQWQS
jgi:acetylglutamate kinase